MRIAVERIEPRRLVVGQELAKVGKEIRIVTRREPVALR